MDVSQILGGTDGLQSMAQQLGVSEAEAQRGASALLPAILGGFKKQPGSVDASGGGGDQILGQIFGSKDVSRTVAQHASTQSGLDPSLLKKMLPMLAMLVTSYLSRRAGAGAGGGGVLGSILGGLTGGGASGGGGLGSMLDRDGDGNPLDDILGMAGKLGR